MDVLRLDLAHPVISGNKFFKLKVAIEQAINQGGRGIISFGGAHSNHLVALAYTCSELGLGCIGIIRGEPPSNLSPSLIDAIRFGMKTIYVSRSDYRNKEQLADHYLGINPGYLLIPEGGQSIQGVMGAAEIMQTTDTAHYDVIACAVGTGTTMAGLLQASLPAQQVLGFSALKLSPAMQTSDDNSIESFISQYSAGRKYAINYDYHFGGYAKKTPALLDFMNHLWGDHQLPTDFVYTGKMFYGLEDLVKDDYFAVGTRILAIHSGGLQGNRSVGDRLQF